MMSGLFKRKVKSALFATALLIGGNSLAQLGLNWSEVGPNDISGRCRSLIIDKNNSSIMYAGGASGGVFKSTDGGGHWAPVNDQAPSLIVSCMAQAADGTIYFGTGETFSRGADGSGTSGFNGTGLYKLNGSTITLVKDSSLFGNVNEVGVDPSDAQRIYVASQKGFFYSTDGGSTFTLEGTNGNTPAMDVKVASDGSVFFSGGTKKSTNSKVYYSPSGTGLYANVTPTVSNSNAIPSKTGNYGRIEIGVAPSNPNVVYLSIATQYVPTTITSSSLAVLYMSTDKGNTWAVITYGSSQRDPLSYQATAAYGDYANTIVVDPNNWRHIYTGAYDLFEWYQSSSLPNGQGNWYSSWLDTQLPNLEQFFMHPKVHDMKFAGGYAYVASDGGISKMFPFQIIGSTPVNGSIIPWNNGLNISQFNSVSMANFPKNSSTTNTVVPVAGVIGGNIGSGLDYIPGNLYTNQTSVHYGATDTYQSDFSKLVPNAAFYSGSAGNVFRTNNVAGATPATFADNQYKGNMSGTSEATPMRLWENYGNLAQPTDSAIFYNPVVVTSFVNSNKTQTSFAVTNRRLQPSAQYQSIVITAVSSKTPAIPTPTQGITITPNYYGSTLTGYSVIGSANNTPTVNNSIVFNNTTMLDTIKFKFLTAPNDSSTITVKISQAFNRYTTLTPSINNSNPTQTSFTMTGIARPKKSGAYQNIVVTATSSKLYLPPAPQSVTITPTYVPNKDSITAYNIAGTTFTAHANTRVGLNNSTYLDSLIVTFSTPPNDSSVISANITFNSRDSITFANTDVSGKPFQASRQLTAPLLAGASSIVKVPLQISGRLAVGLRAGVFVAKRPINFALNPDWFKISGANSKRDSPGGVATSTDPITPTQGTITVLEWSPDGRSIYYSSKLNDTTFFVYRISHLDFLGDSTAADYSGYFSSDIDSATSVRKANRIRTTAIGKFKYPITSISVLANNSGILVTTGGYTNKTATVYTSNGDVRTLNYNVTDNSNFTSRNGTGLPLFPVYSSLFEMSDNKHVLLGTESGVYSTTDITAASPVWVKETGSGGSMLPNVPVFQIRQQTMRSWECYNSGEIYIATHGRGIWSTDKYLSPYMIGVKEIEKNIESGVILKLYPNPANENVNVWFNNNNDGASFMITVMDISGRVVMQQAESKLMAGDHIVPMNTHSLNNGVYFVNVSGINSNFSATSKLIIAR